MKKIVFILLVCLFCNKIVYAFDIDISEVSLSSKSDSLINLLDKSYNIELDGFDKVIIDDENIKSFIKNVTLLSLSDKTFDDKFSEFSKSYLYASSTNGFDTLTGSLFIRMFLEELDNKNIEANYIRDIKIVKFREDDAISFVYLPNSKVNNETKEVVLIYWLKKENNDYKVYYPWLTIDDDLENYFKQVTLQEDKGEVIGGTFNKISLTGEDSVKVSEELLRNIYDNNKLSNVQITGMSESGSNIYGSGFVIREGIIVTTWSNFLKFLTESNYIYVNDCEGNTYEIDGIVTADTNYDVVVLKLKNEVLEKVTLGNPNELKVDDKLFTINSKENSTFSINYGTFISINNGRIKNLFALSSGDVGSALYNSNGEVIGFNVGDVLYSDLSYANSISYLKKLQDILVNQDFSNIGTTDIEIFKESYYNKYDGENEYNNINQKDMNEYKKVGNIFDKITLPLIKASLVDDILSLRYKNEIGNMLDSMYLVSGYTEELEKEGYKLTYQNSNKMIYQNNKYRVIIKNNLNYLIILIMEN